MRVFNVGSYPDATAHVTPNAWDTGETYIGYCADERAEALRVPLFDDPTFGRSGVMGVQVVWGDPCHLKDILAGQGPLFDLPDEPEEDDE
jgi:hypothetical protein